MQFPRIFLDTHTYIYTLIYISKYGLKIWSVRTIFPYQPTILCKYSLCLNYCDSWAHTQKPCLQQILHWLCCKYNMQPAAIMLPLGKCLKFINGRTVNSEKSLLLLFYLEVLLQIHKKCIMPTVVIKFKIPWNKV